MLYMLQLEVAFIGLVTEALIGHFKYLSIMSSTQLSHVRTYVDAIEVGDLLVARQLWIATGINIRV
jgi:hypothetical protein